jgi:hypothetical protein
MTSEARLLLNVAIVLLVDGVLVAACLYAWIKGTAAERYSALLYGLAALGTLVFEVATRQALPVMPMLALDAAVAIGFLVFAIRYNSLWLGAAMMLKGAQLALHGFHLTDLEDARFAGMNLYAVFLDLISLLISSAIIGGTRASLRARRRLAAPSLQPQAA